MVGKKNSMRLNVERNWITTITIKPFPAQFIKRTLLYINLVNQSDVIFLVHGEKRMKEKTILERKRTRTRRAGCLDLVSSSRSIGAAAPCQGIYTAGTGNGGDETRSLPE